MPWGQPLERQTSTAAYAFDVTPGEFVLRTLFAEFTILAEKKIETILNEPLVSFCIILGFYCIGALDGRISERLESEIIFIFRVSNNRKFYPRARVLFTTFDLIGASVQFKNN